MLKVNDRIPAFEGLTPEGVKVHVDYYLGRRVWVALYRYAGCPLCTIHLAEIHHRHRALAEAGIEVLAVFESPAGRFFGPGGGAQINRSLVPLIADPQRRVYETLGASQSSFALLSPAVGIAFGRALLKGFRQGPSDGNLSQLPAHFLVDREGMIRAAHYGRHAADHIPWTAVEQFAGRKLPREALNPNARPASIPVAPPAPAPKAPKFTAPGYAPRAIAVPPSSDPFRPARVLPPDTTSIELEYSPEELDAIEAKNVIENRRSRVGTDLIQMNHSDLHRKRQPSGDND